VHGSISIHFSEPRNSNIRQGGAFRSFKSIQDHSSIGTYRKPMWTSLLSLSDITVYWLYMLLIAATEMTLSAVTSCTLCSWNGPAPFAGNTGLHLSRSVSAKQSGWLSNLGTDAGTCEHCTNTCLRHQRLWPARRKAAPHRYMGKHITKRHRWSSWSTEKAVTCKHKGKRTSL